MITHTIESYWIPSQKKTKSKLQILKNFEFWNGHYTRHTFLSCLIRCANMKWIQWVLLKIQSGHDSVHRRTDGQTDRRTDGQCDTSIPPFNFVEAGGIINRPTRHVFLHNCLAAFIQQGILWSLKFKLSSIVTPKAVHDDVIKWKHFPRYWPFVRGIHWSPVNSLHKSQWRGALAFSLIWINAWVNNREAGDLRCHCPYYDVIVITLRDKRATSTQL